MILVMHLDNNGIRHNCEDLVQELEKSVKQDGRISLQREGELDWFKSLSVGDTYDKITGTIGSKQEACINRVLVKYRMKNVNACKLAMYWTGVSQNSKAAECVGVLVIINGLTSTGV